MPDRKDKQGNAGGDLAEPMDAEADTSSGAPGGGDPGGMGGIATRGSASTGGGGVSPIQKVPEDE